MHAGQRPRGPGHSSGGPEFNLIQAPEVLLRLARYLGLRQAHTAPTLNEGVQPVVIIGDVSKAPTTAVFATYRQKIETITAGANVFMQAVLANPAGSGVLLRLISVDVGTNGLNAILVAGAVGVPAITAQGIQTDTLSTQQRISAATLFGSIGVAALAVSDWGKFMLGDGKSVTLLRPSNFIIPPGLAFSIGNSVAFAIGIATTVVFEWSEEPSPVTS
jgi:hypothetical protein